MDRLVRASTWRRPPSGACCFLELPPCVDGVLAAAKRRLLFRPLAMLVGAAGRSVPWTLCASSISLQKTLHVVHMTDSALAFLAAPGRGWTQRRPTRAIHSSHVAKDREHGTGLVSASGPRAPGDPTEAQDSGRSTMPPRFPIYLVDSRPTGCGNGPGWDLARIAERRPASPVMCSRASVSSPTALGTVQWLKAQAPGSRLARLGRTDTCERLSYPTRPEGQSRGFDGAIPHSDTRIPNLPLQPRGANNSKLFVSATACCQRSSPRVHALAPTEHRQSLANAAFTSQTNYTDVADVICDSPHVAHTLRSWRPLEFLRHVAPGRPVRFDPGHCPSGRVRLVPRPASSCLGRALRHLSWI